MENILLFVATVTIYSLVMGCLILNFNFSWTRFIKKTALIALLVLPINIGGNVFTIAGNATAEKSVYSLFSLYQKAGRDAMTFAGLAYQQAGQDAFTVIGLTYQKAGQDARTGLGLAGYQRAERGDAMAIVGLVGYQKAERKAKVPAAIAFYQRVGEKTRAFGAFSTLTKD